MKLLAPLALVLCTSLAPAVHAQYADPLAAARQAAADWLALVDAGKYALSWQQAAPVFQAAVTQPAWSDAVRSVRAPLGAVTSRTWVSGHFTDQLPGAAAGKYAVLRFSTAFENKLQSVETVTPMRDGCGQWRVAGYFVQ